MTTQDLHSTLAAVGPLHRVRDEALLQEHGLHAGQEFLLELLWEEDGLTPGELAQRRGIDTATVTVTAQRMEQAGMVRRVPDPEHRRLIRVST
jgi:MarR family transcriptional regulator, organic hydroperoxide resistance regulator